MTKILFISFFIFYSLIPFIGFADTIDVWTIRRNNEIIIRSNQMLIVHSNQPMQVNLSTFSDNDTLKIYYWTDTDGESMMWHYIFKDANDLFIDKFTNEIDSSIRCYPTPCKIFNIRKSFIPFAVKDLRKLMREKNIESIFVEFEHEKPNWSESYRIKKYV